MKETRLYTIRRKAAEKKLEHWHKKALNELYGKYAKREDIPIVEAMRRVNKLEFNR